MEKTWIEPKMIDFGNNEVNKAQKTLNRKVDEGYKRDDDLWGKKSKK
jgi:hypothetical protein